MEAIFSGDVNESHYRPRIVDLTGIDDVPPPMDAQGRILDHDWELPDAMKVSFKDSEDLE
ncbi:MAG: hypothetical protein QFB87_03360 [Patescibacteria group bacterium]|nr:hypothetical protein [Patescibacteria group bacterium]